MKPLPPNTCTAASACRTHPSDAYSLAIEQSVSASAAPVSRARAASTDNAVPARSSVATVARENEMPWFAEIGLPNWLRSRDCRVAASSAARLMPRLSPEIPRRPLASTFIM